METKRDLGPLLLPSSSRLYARPTTRAPSHRDTSANSYRKRPGLTCASSRFGSRTAVLRTNEWGRKRSSRGQPVPPRPPSGTTPGVWMTTTQAIQLEIPIHAARTWCNMFKVRTMGGLTYLWPSSPATFKSRTPLSLIHNFDLFCTQINKNSSTTSTYFPHYMWTYILANLFYLHMIRRACPLQII